MTAFESKQGEWFDAKYNSQVGCVQECKEQDCSWENVVRKGRSIIFCPRCMSSNIGFKGLRVKEVGDGS